MVKKIKNILGLTIIEALVSTVIVGIGFVAVFQMVNYSVRSIDTSGERTKANFLVSMMAEDVIGYKHSIYGVNSAADGVVIGIDGTITVDGESKPDAKKFAEHLNGEEFVATECGTTKMDTDTADSEEKSGSEERKTDTGIYNTEFTDAPSNKEEKWMRIFSEHRYLKCRGKKDIKKMKVYKICRWATVCPGFVDPSVTEDGLYIGRIQFNLNNGKKRKILYFQADYNIRK